MTTEHTTLTERLLDRPQGFDLFQAISLLERAGVAEGRAEIGEVGIEAVRLRSHLSLGFEASDVKAAGRAPATGEAFSLTTPVLSLAGHAGPLPTAFTELLLARRAARDHAGSDFLDIFHHRLLSLFYLNRKRRRIGLGWKSPQASTVARASARLCGLQGDMRAGHAPRLRHAGLLGGAPRSMAALCALLSDRYGMPFTGEQFVGGWQRLEKDELTALGDRRRAPELGRTAFVGRRVWDQAAAVRLSVQGLPATRLMQLLPGGSLHTDFKAAVRHFMPSALRVEVCLTPAAGELPEGRLSASGAPRLGWNAWMGENGSAPRAARFTFECADDEH